MSEILRISSVKNEAIIRAAKLLKTKERRLEKRFLLTGDKLVYEAINNGFSLSEIFILEGSDFSHFVKLKKVKVYEVTENVMKKLTELKSLPNVVAVCEMKEKEELKLERGKQYIALENIQDMSNVGNILRTAEAFGIEAVIFLGMTVDIYSEKVLRGSMGSSLRVKTFETESNSLFELAKKLDIPVMATAIDKDAKELSNADFSKGSIVAIGNEGQGLSKEMLDLCTDIVYIEMKGITQSLSAPIAAALVMYRQQECL